MRSSPGAEGNQVVLHVTVCQRQGLQQAKQNVNQLKQIESIYKVQLPEIAAGTAVSAATPEKPLVIRPSAGPAQATACPEPATHETAAGSLRVGLNTAWGSGSILQQTIAMKPWASESYNSLKG